MALSGTAVTGAVHYYLYRRLVKHTQIGSPWRQIAKWTIFALFLSVFLSFIVRRYMPFEIGRVVMFVPYIWMGSITFIFLILLVSDLMKLVLSGIRKVGGGKPTDPERRIFFARMAAAISAVTAVGFGAFAVPNALRKAQVKLVEVKLARLPKVLSGFTIVQITDLHIGINLGRAWAEQVVQQVNALKPDLIAITGDLVDGSPDRLRYEVEPLADLKAPNGVFFVTGNHEYYSGITEWIPELEKLGMRVLRNERVSVGLGKASFDQSAWTWSRPEKGSKRSRSPKRACSACPPAQRGFRGSRAQCGIAPVRPYPWWSVLAIYLLCLYEPALQIRSSQTHRQYPSLRQRRHRLLGSTHAPRYTRRDNPGETFKRSG